MKDFTDLGADQSSRSADEIRLARLVLSEDGDRDITSELVDLGGTTVEGTISLREQAVVAGLAYAESVAAEAGCDNVQWCVQDGTACKAGDALGVVRGTAASVLLAERPILNLLQRGCGIATRTRMYVEAVSDTNCRILHTRKTAPGLRFFDVRAVVHGGGEEHRLGLDRTVLIKDNHWEALGRESQTLPALCSAARRRGVDLLFVEIENTEQMELACRAGADRLLIDNQPPEEFRRFVRHAKSLRPEIEIEATGGINLDNVRLYAEAGADYASVGELTHSASAIDVTLGITVV